MNTTLWLIGAMFAFGTGLPDALDKKKTPGAEVWWLLIVMAVLAWTMWPVVLGSQMTKLWRTK